MRPIFSALALSAVLVAPVGALAQSTTVIQTGPGISAPPSGSVTTETRRQSDGMGGETVSKSRTYQSDDGTVSRSHTVTRSDGVPGTSTTTTTTHTVP
ncbi:MAG TPA: hypothetical protein VHS58_08350 [Acetobacteraceae bacterium]|jgi:hypothetical protein|nr:hypothetical protein [Acetobacteraceae bacterium]